MAGPAALRDGRLGRRRQVDPHRAAALRQQVGVRRPARGRRAHLRGPRRRLHQPGAAHRRPAGRARAGHHDRRRLPVLLHAGALVHRGRHPRARAVHPQHGHRRLDRRPRAGARRRPQGRHRADPPARLAVARCCACRTWCWRSTRWTSSTSTRRCSTPSSRTSREFAARALGAARRRPPSRWPRCTGDNVVHRSERMPWYDGPALLEHLEQVAGRARPRRAPSARFPVQYVIRPMSTERPDYRGYAGTVASGTLRVGDEVVVLPSGRSYDGRRRSTPPTDRSSRPSPVRPSRCGWPTRSTSAAAT